MEKWNWGFFNRKLPINCPNYLEQNGLHIEHVWRSFKKCITFSLYFKHFIQRSKYAICNPNIHYMAIFISSVKYAFRI